VEDESHETDHDAQGGGSHASRADVPSFAGGVPRQVGVAAKIVF